MRTARTTESSAARLLQIAACLSAVLFLHPTPSLADRTANWDVTNTGLPFTETSFTLTEGTWMSVDVSPDGRTLMFDLLGDIYSLPTGGGEARLIHGGPAMQRMPSFSADGSRLLYLSDASGADNAWTSGIDGAAPKQITFETKNMMSAPTWGPDNSVAAVTSSPLFPKLDAPEIRLFDPGGGAGRLLVDSPQPGRDVQEPRFSPDGRYLYYTERLMAPAFVYFDANQLNYAVRRRELSTGKTDQLIDGFGGAIAPQISRDGRRLAFVRRVQGKTVLFSYEFASGAQRPVYDELDRDAEASYGQQGAYYPRFSWFPDNRHVAIWGKGKLYRIDMDTGAAAEIPFRATATHRLTKAPRFTQDLAPERFTVRTMRQLAPAPDGKSIVFTAVGSLWRKTLPDGVPVRLTRATAFELEPAWSGDGKWLTYVEWDDERGGALKVISAKGGAARTVTSSHGLIREPSFSPDGKSIIYRIHAGDKLMGGFRTRAGVYVVPVSGGDGRYVAMGNETPRFSADGTRIFYTTLGSAGAIVRKLIEPGARTLKSVTLDGLDEREHVKTQDVDTLDLRLSPDGRWLAFRERQQYYVMRYRETGSPMTVTARSDVTPVARLTELGGYSLTWSSDSTRLYWTLGPALYRADIADLFAANWKPPQPYAQFDLTLPTDRPNGVVAFTNARIITMRGEEVIERGTVVIERNRIAAIGAADSVTVPAGAKVIDASGKTIMPGLIDMHGHTECCIGIGAVGQKQSTRYAQLAFGVTTNVDPYSREQLAYESNETNLAGVTVSPRWIPSGAAIYGLPQMVDSSFVPIDTYEDARIVMLRKRALGGTFIKSYRQRSRQQRQMLVKAGHEVGIMVDVEGEGQFYDNISEVFDGHTGLEHNLPLAHYYDDVIQLMQHGDTSNTPTLVVLFGELLGENYLYQTQQAWKDPKIRTYVQEIQSSSSSPLAVPGSAPPYARGMTTIHASSEVWDVGFRAVSRSIKKLDDAGVIVNAGSHGQVPGLSLHWEMWLLAEGGMSNHRILRTATLNGARTLALDKQIGSLEPGKLADLIVLDANPLDDIHNTTTVRYTMLNGRLYDSLSMNEIGNYDRPRTRFYWELEDYRGIDWNESWAGQ